MSGTAPTKEPTEIRSAIDNHQKELEGRVGSLKKLQGREHRLAIGFKRTGVGFLTVGATLIVAVAFYNFSALGICGAASTVLGIGLLVFSLDHTGEERRIQADLQRLEFECDLLKLHPNGDECRAEKLLGNNDSQLRSYYELNLEQCSKIFWIGILCLCAGVGVIAATLHIVKLSQDNEHTQIVSGVVGAVGTILINYVAAIFLRMHSEILTILKEFQNKLIGTQELYLANVLASRINQDEKRAETLQSLSLAMVRCGGISKNNTAK